MRLPIRCPICSDIMLTDFRGTSLTGKSCKSHLYHQANFTADANDNVFSIKLRISNNPQLWVTWDYFMNIVHINPVELPKATGLVLPFFEPDFDDYRKLVDKLKTYIVFS